jgi:hypothetical protein
MGGAMTQDEIIEMAIQGHASTRDAIRWAMKQEREACAKEVEDALYGQEGCGKAAKAIRARGET